MVSAMQKVMQKTIQKVIFFVIGTWLMIGLTGCSSNEFTIDLTPIQNGNVPTVRSTTEYDTWTSIAEGIDIRQQLVTVDTTELFTLVRFDPNTSPMRIAVDSEHPKTVSEWQTELEARVVLNGSYFDETYHLTTEVITDGETYGNRLTGKTAFLQTQNGAQWDILSATEVAKKATTVSPAPQVMSMQSYPLLIQAGQSQVTESSDDQSPRTIVALDTSGYMYFIIAEYGLLNLRQLDDVLLNELSLDVDIDLDAALNVDGGTSTGLAVSGQTTYMNDSLLVPAVLYIQ